MTASSKTVSAAQAYEELAAYLKSPKLRLYSGGKPVAYQLQQLPSLAAWSSFPASHAFWYRPLQSAAVPRDLDNEDNFQQLGLYIEQGMGLFNAEVISGVVVRLELEGRLSGLQSARIVARVAYDKFMLNEDHIVGALVASWVALAAGAR